MVRASAALLVSPGVVEVEEVDFSLVGPGQVEVRMAAAGICHTDLHIRDSPDGWGKSFPLLLGHEGSGIVVDAGDGVLLEPGDHVAIACRVPCGSCALCRRGDARRCKNSAPRPARIQRSTDQSSVTPALGVGLFADTVVVDAMAAVKVDPLIPLDVAAILGCALMTGVGAVTNTARVFPGATVAVIGCGGIGLSVVLGALLAGASKVIAIDLVPSKLSWASRLGATDVIDSSEENPVDRVREITGGEGVDFAFEAVGLATCVEQGLAMLAYGGVATVIGVPPRNHEVTFPLGGPSGFLANTNSLLVTHGGDSLPQHDLDVFASLILQGRLDVAKMISHRISLEDLDEGFQMMKAGESVRAVVVLDNSLVR